MSILVVEYTFQNIRINLHCIRLNYKQLSEQKATLREGNQKNATRGIPLLNNFVLASHFCILKSICKLVTGMAHKAILLANLRLDVGWSTLIPYGDPLGFKREFSESCFGNYDAIFANSDVKNGLIDFNLFQQYMFYVGDIITTLTLGNSVKKFIDFLIDEKVTHMLLEMRQNH